MSRKRDKRRGKWDARLEELRQKEKAPQSMGKTSNDSPVWTGHCWKQIVVGGSNTWTSDLEIIEKCGKAGVYIPHCYVTQEAWIKMAAFLLGADEKFHGKEVGFYLLGDLSNPDAWLIDGIHIPKQKPVTCHVDEMESLAVIGDREIIGVAHILPTKGGEEHRSQPDKDTLEGNHAISLTFGNGLAAIANLRIKLPCGAYRMAQALPEIIFDDDVQAEATTALDMIEAHVKEIEEKSKSSIVVYSSNTADGNSAPKHIEGFTPSEKIDGGWRYTPERDGHGTHMTEEEIDKWLEDMQKENEERQAVLREGSAVTRGDKDGNKEDSKAEDRIIYGD